MFKIAVDGYRWTSARDYYRVCQLLKLQAEWDQEDINAAYDKIDELNEHIRRVEKERRKKK